MRAIRMVEHEGTREFFVSPLHLVTWEQNGSYTGFELSTDDATVGLRKTATPASDITRQFNEASDDFSTALGPDDGYECCVSCGRSFPADDTRRCPVDAEQALCPDCAGTAREKAAAL